MPFRLRVFIWPPALKSRKLPFREKIVILYRYAEPAGGRLQGCRSVTCAGAKDLQEKAENTVKNVTVFGIHVTGTPIRNKPSPRVLLIRSPGSSLENQQSCGGGERSLRALLSPHGISTVGLRRRPECDGPRLVAIKCSSSMSGQDATLSSICHGHNRIVSRVAARGYLWNDHRISGIKAV